MPQAGYNYASAKIRALEPAILDVTDMERMADAPDFATAFKVLNDTDYADNLLDVDALEYRQALKDDYRQLYDLLKDITPNNDLFKLIFIERDIVNIKLLFKAKFFEVEVDAMLRDNTIYQSSHLKEFIFDKKDSGLDQDIKDLINNVEKIIDESSRPDFIDSIITKEYFRLIKKIAKKINNQLVDQLIISQINNANILTWLRAKRLGLAKERLAEKLVTGGNIDPKKLIDQYSEEVKNIRTLINVYYDKQVIEALDNYAENNLLFEFEKALEDYKTRVVQKTQRIAAGPEVIYAYHLAKQNAVANIRIILTGKLNNISGEEIKKTLRLVK
ncbi:MAG: hypothetical protein CMI53_00730 [Parcubacteria group bacterium]|nr:hypothetical protein [Parcubacteria group bacterium]|tara:strand:+ start:2848 stop:3840 length:993 start_codon:yes stop_codon:yes gene_type:complete